MTVAYLEMLLAFWYQTPTLIAEISFATPACDQIDPVLLAYVDLRALGALYIPELLEHLQVPLVLSQGLFQVINDLGVLGADGVCEFPA